jgi:hypothetical protein
VNAVSDLFRGGRTVAFGGPQGTDIDASLYQRNRHEAGLARLGSVRHI